MVNLFFSQLINLNTKQLPADNPELKHQCLLILDEFTSIGKVGVIAKSVAFIAGYNLRLLPIIQSISQLESVYGEKDTRTFVTNHALQILYPPREQKDANEYSEVLGYLTEKAVSKGESRPRAWGGANPGSNSENVSDQRRALMLPQELKELGQEREIVILENTKPILCDKARYYADDVFLNRLKEASPSLRALGKVRPTQMQLEDAAFVRSELSARVPLVDVDLHKAKMETRLRPLRSKERIDVSKLAASEIVLPAYADPERPTEREAKAISDTFFAAIDWAEPSAPQIPADHELTADAQPASAEVVPIRPRSRHARSRAIDLSVLDQ